MSDKYGNVTVAELEETVRILMSTMLESNTQVNNRLVSLIKKVSVLETQVGSLAIVLQNLTGVKPSAEN